MTGWPLADSRAYTKCECLKSTSVDSIIIFILPLLRNAHICLLFSDNFLQFNFIPLTALRVRWILENCNYLRIDEYRNYYHCYLPRCVMPHVVYGDARLCVFVYLKIEFRFSVDLSEQLLSRCFQFHFSYFFLAAIECACTCTMCVCLLTAISGHFIIFAFSVIITDMRIVRVAPRRAF